MKIKGFISALFLYYLLLIATLVSAQLESFRFQLQTMEMLEYLSEDIGSLNHALAFIYCETMNHNEDYSASFNSISVEGINDYQESLGMAQIYGNQGVSIEYNFDLNDLSLHIESIKYSW